MVLPQKLHVVTQKGRSYKLRFDLSFSRCLGTAEESCRNCCATKIQDVIFANFSPTLSLSLCVPWVRAARVSPHYTLHTTHYTLYTTHYTLYTTQGVFTCNCLHSSHQQHKYLHPGPLLVPAYTLHCTDTYTNQAPLSPCVVCGWLAVTARTEAAFITETIPGMLIVDNRAAGLASVRVRD